MKRNGNTVTLAEEFDSMLEQEGFTKHISLYKERHVWNVLTAMKLFIRIYFGLQTHLQLITKKLKGNFIFTIILKNSILTLKHSILT